MEKTVVFRPLDAQDDLGELVELLYGDGAFEIRKALSDKERKQKALTNAAIATNAVGSVAGPAALYSAVRHREEGGIPRDIASSAAPRMKRSSNRAVRSAGTQIERGVKALNKPKGRGARYAAGAAGAGLIGLQAINWGGDMLSTKLLNDQKKDKVAKNQQVVMDRPPAEKPVAEPVKIKLVRLGADAAFDTARTAPMVAAKQKAKKQAKVAKNETGMDIHWQGEISKMDTDKRQVFGWASIIEIDGKPVVDLQGDVMTVEEIEKAAYNYVKESRKGGHEHERSEEGPRHVSDLVESFLVTPEKKEQMGLPDSVPTGWWVGFQVHDDEVWDKVKDGKLKNFSIHGSGVRKNVEVD